MVGPKEKKRESSTIRIGPLMKKALEKQKEKIKEVTYDYVESSDWEAGEIIAKKVLETM